MRYIHMCGKLQSFHAPCLSEVVKEQENTLIFSFFIHNTYLIQFHSNIVINKGFGKKKSNLLNAYDLNFKVLY